MAALAACDNKPAAVPAGEKPAAAPAAEKKAEAPAVVQASQAKFTGKLSIDMTGGNFLLSIETPDGSYQFITSDATTYKGIEVTPDNIRWQGGRYQITGEFPSKRETPVKLGDVKGIIDASVVERLGDAE